MFAAFVFVDIAKSSSTFTAIWIAWCWARFKFFLVFTETEAFEMFARVGEMG